MNELSQQSQNVSDNEKSLQELAWTITMSEGQFSIIFTKCNYSALREQIVQRLKEICSVKVREIVLDRSVTRLYSTIRDELSNEQPAAVMVFGLESVSDINQVLTLMNQVREEFRKSFPFPLVLWVNDEILKKLIRLAPDFESWTASPISFKLTTNELIDFLQSITNRVFSAVLDTDADQFLPNAVIIKPLNCSELESAQRELQNRGQELEPGLQAGWEFFLGRNAYVNDQLNEALAHYQHSLEFWQQRTHLERQGVLLFHIGLCYLRNAELDGAERQHHWQKARHYLQQCITIFEQAQRPDLVAKFTGQLSEVLQCLEAWSDLQTFAQNSLKLHQTYGSPIELARDYGFLAEVALNLSNWEDARQLSQQALQTLANASEEQSRDQWLYRLLLAKSQRHLGQQEEAKKNLKIAKYQGNPREDLKLYIYVLEELRSLYSEQCQYLKAFEIKRERRSIERQYDLVAFVGADQLLSPKLMKYQQAETHKLIAPELAASGRSLDVERLIDRIRRYDCKLTVLHGQSGVGKSSLLNAGLVPALKHRTIESRDFLPVTVRVYTDWITVLGKSLVEALEEKSIRLPSLLDSEEVILAQLRANEDRNLQTVLIFDQFEEFFFVYTNRNERRLLFEFLRSCLDLPFVKVILSMREDYLHYLLELNRIICFDIINNDILSKYTLYHLSNLRPEDAKSLLISLTERANFYLEPALVDQLVHDLAGELGDVRPIELQIVGWQLQAENITTLAEYKERGSKERLVRRFLEEVIEDCGSENENTAWLVLYLLTNENGTRPLKTDTELAATSELEPKKLEFILDVLVKSGIIVLIPETSTKLYQLVHDYLVFFIRQKYRSTLILELEITKELELTKGQLKQALIQEQQESQRAEVAEIMALSSLSQALLLSNDQLMALVAGVAAGKKLQQTKVPSEVKIRTICRLRQAVYSVRERNRLQGHEAEVSNISFSPDGQILASGSKDGTTKLWCLDGSEVQTFPGHDSGVTSISFSPNGKTLASASGDGIIKIWRLDGSEVQTFQGHRERIISITFSPSEQILASSSSDGTVKLWSVNDYQPQVLHEYHDLVYDLSFSPDGHTLACASEDGTVKLWYLDSNKLPIAQGSSERVSSVRFNPNGQILVSASLDGTVKLWRVNGTELQKLITFQAHRDWVTRVSFSPNGQTLASASEDGTVKLWSLNGDELQTFRGHADKVTSVSFSPDGQTLASSGGEGTVKLWCLRGNQLKVLPGHANKVTSVSFSPDSQTLASADEKGSVKLWRLDGTELATLQNHSSRVTSICFSPDGQTLASADKNGNVEFWCLDSNEPPFPLLHNYGITCVSFSPNGEILAFAGEDGTIELWSKDVAEMQASYKSRECVTSISFSPNNQILAFASLHGRVTLWRLTLGTSQFCTLALLMGTETLAISLLWVMLFPKGDAPKIFGHSKKVTDLSFSPDGKILATASEDCSAKLWNINGTELQLFRGHKKRITSVSFHPDGKVLATASEDCTIKLWSFDGTELQTFQGHSNWITDISFSPDGKTLASASQDGTVILWNLDLDDLLLRACNWLDDFLKTNPNVSESDRHLCDGIIPQKGTID
ncbi:MAG: AAA family ATPase [Coleofasciculus sp. B1-GNL1-01]|uniref:WD40 domain-containing protein n=1 Tax=Coleofasciculus sp. B1-GNL1-01 TaxID=3068484 RepID=UPI0032F0A329